MAYKNLDDDKEYYAGYNNLVKDISVHIGIKPEIVRYVLDGFIDVAVSYVVNTGELRIPNLFIIKPIFHKGGIFQDKKGRGRPRLQGKVSPKLRSLWKIRLDELNGDKSVINHQNWRKVYEAFPQYWVNNNLK